MRLLEGVGVWVEEGHAATVRILHDQRLSARTLQPTIRRFSTDDAAADALHAEVDRWFIYTDDPFNGRLRTILQPAFSPRAIAALEHGVEAAAHELIDRVAARGQADLAVHVAEELPTAAMGLLLGVELASADLLEDVHAIGAYIGAFGQHGLAEAVAAVEHLTEVADDAIARASGAREGTLLDVLLGAAEAGVLDPVELRSTVVMLVFAALETTRGLLAEIIHVLASRPDVGREVRRAPELAEALVQEILRLHPPTAFTSRAVPEELEVEGVTVVPGQFVLCDLRAANRDPSVFGRPDEIDLHRRGGQVLSFGHGAHHCVGAALARLEGRVTARVVLDRLPDLRLAGTAEEAAPGSNLVYRSRRSLPVEWTVG